jgi:ABC-2 type transport system permease protein
MKKTYLVMVQELRTTLGRKTFTIIGFGIPVLLGIVVLAIIVINRDKVQETASSITAATAEISKTSPEGYVDEGKLIQFLPDGTPGGWLTEFPDESSAKSAMDSGEIEAYYLVSSDYEESGELAYVRPTFNPLRDQTNTDIMEWILLANLLGDARLAEQVWHPINTKVTPLESAEVASADDSWIVELFPTLMTLILYMAIVMSSSVLVAAITDEKKNRVMEVLLSSVSTGQMITGKLLAVAILGLLLLLTWMGVFLMVAVFGGRTLGIPLDYSVPIDILIWASVFGLLGYAIYGALMAGLGALAPDVKDTRSATMVVLGPLIIAYILMMFIYTSPDGPVAITLSLFPLTSPVSMIGRMAISEVPVWQALLAVALQLAAAIIVVRLVVRLFRAQTLLSGQQFETKRFLAALLGRV